jgi:hypothetical protein
VIFFVVVSTKHCLYWYLPALTHAFHGVLAWGDVNQPFFGVRDFHNVVNVWWCWLCVCLSDAFPHLVQRVAIVVFEPGGNSRKQLVDVVVCMANDHKIDFNLVNNKKKLTPPSLPN